MASSEKIYEGALVTVKAAMSAEHAKKLKSLIFKFHQDGDVPKPDDLSGDSDFEKKYASADVGADGTLEHRVHAPKVPGDKDTYLLSYDIFYEVEGPGGKLVRNQELSVKRFEVFPRTAKLKAVWDKDGKPFPDFRFKVTQNGVQVGDVRHTLIHDTKNVNDETIPAGGYEFNLEMVPGYAIVQAGPWEIVSHVKDDKDKRNYAVKGDLKFRAEFRNPAAGRIRQYVNYDPEDLGQQGVGYEVVVEIGSDSPGSGKQEVHFRAAFGPDSVGKVAKSTRKDAAFPTKVEKADKADAATIEEKKAGELYQGKIELTHGLGRLKLRLGRAGGDTCKLEIAGSDKFLTDKAVTADQVLEIENWRRVHYELMVPDTLFQDVLDRETLDLRADARLRLEGLGRQVFVDFEHADTRIFDSLAQADFGSLGSKRFFGLPGDPELAAYVLSGRNWRQTPRGQAWSAEHPAKTLYISVCDLLMKWKRGTADEGAGPKDFSGNLTEASGVIDVMDRFQGLFMPFSGNDGGAGVTDVEWSADISNGDPLCKIKPELAMEEARYAFVPSDEVTVEIHCGAMFGLPLELGFRAGSDGRFNAKLDETQTARMQDFVDDVLANKAGLARSGGKVKAEFVCAQVGDKGEDDCLAAAKAKFRELFDKAKRDTFFHPGLTDAGEPRSGTCTLTEITDMPASTAREWRFVLPVGMRDGSPGPGAFVGPKSKDKCPVKFGFSFQPHEISAGEAEGKLLAWAGSLDGAGSWLLRMVLRGFGGETDAARPEHGHGDAGEAGDCLAEADALCGKCLEYGRGASLAAL